MDPPSGQVPPAEVQIAGRKVDVARAAERVTDAYLSEFPSDLERYGEHTRAWGVHDTRWLLAWAALDGDDQGVDFQRQLDWLARVLAARDFPLDRLARNLELAAREVRQEIPEAVEPLLAGASRLRTGTDAAAARRR